MANWYERRRDRRRQVFIRDTKAFIAESIDNILTGLSVITAMAIVLIAPAFFH